VCVNVGGRGSKSHSFCWTPPLKPCARTQRKHKHKHTCPPSSPLHTSPAASKWTPPPRPDLISSCAQQWPSHRALPNDWSTPIAIATSSSLNPIRFISCFCL
jgi:hypothetical protein